MMSKRYIASKYYRLQLNIKSSVDIRSKICSIGEESMGNIFKLIWKWAQVFILGI